MAFNSGDPEFPRPAIDDRGCPREAQSGMSLLDWFAGMALQGIIASGPVEPADQPDPATLAAWAYGIADAMVSQRSK